MIVFRKNCLTLHMFRSSSLPSAQSLSPLQSHVSEMQYALSLVQLNNCDFSQARLYS